jgi:hypothetical protein
MPSSVSSVPVAPPEVSLVDKSLEDYWLDTVKMFHDDARAAGFSLDVVPTA